MSLIGTLRHRPHIGKKITALGAAAIVGIAGLVGSPAAFADRTYYAGVDLPGINAWGALPLGGWVNQTPSIGGVAVDADLQWCIDGLKQNPGPGDLTSISTLTDSHQWVADLALSTPQAAWMLQKYQHNTDDTVTIAALGLLMHANFDNTQSVGQQIASVAQSTHPEVYNRALAFVVEARNSAAVGYEGGTVTGDGERTGDIHNIGVHPDSGNAWLAGIPVTATIDGPAVFDATGTKTWTGTTTNSPITLKWNSTGNGTVTTNIAYETKYRRTLTKFGSDGSIQDMISYGNRPASDPETVTTPGPSWRVIYDFRPVATSNVGDSKIVDGGSISDTVTASADPSYGDGTWTKLDGTYVPVVFEGAAYYTGETPAAEAVMVPSDAKLVGTASITATGPGTYTASIAGSFDPSVITWVWTVSKDAQGDYAKYVHADWSDHFGLADETASIRHTASIDTSISTRVTKSGTYLVDDVFVDSLPSDHPGFAGGAGLGADVKTLDQTLLFFPEGLEVTDANAAKAETIASVTVPAANGFYPSVGSTKFKMKDSTPGTYVFVTSFAGDDRVKPLVTSVTDVTEQYVVTAEAPTLQTTATNADDGSKVLPNTGTATFTDQVCYTNLTVGKEYTLTGTLMDQATEAPIVDADGNPITATVTHTPTKADDCVTVPFTVDASLLAGKTTVVFERLYEDGKLIAVHTDINDAGQTVTTPGTPTVGTTASDGADGDKVITPSKKVTINDLVCYTNLTVGKQYTIKGELMNQATGEPVLVGGKPVTAEVVHTPTKADDCVTVPFTFDGSGLGGHSVTVFERLYQGDVLVASHADINDKGQTVKFTQPTPPLPNTGAAVNILIGIGVVLLIAGVTMTVVSRRKKDAEV